jgi:uncharacterized protein involved in outer membrane biogenesis
MRRVLKWVGISLAVLVIAVAVLLAFFDWNRLRGPISSRVSETLDRRFAIRGDLDVDLSFTPRITVNQVELANASWGRRPEMFTLEQLQFSIRLLELLRGRLVLPEIKISRPRLFLEKNPKGQGNWEFGETRKGEPAKRTDFPKIGRVTLDRGTLDYRDVRTDTKLDLDISTAVGTAEDQAVELKGDGSFQQEKFTLRIQGGSVLSLWETKAPYPIDINIAFGATRASVKGTVEEPLQMKRPDLALDLQGPDLAKLYPIIGVSLPQTPPYKLAGRLVRQKEEWQLKKLKGAVGNSDLSGDIAYGTRGERPYLRGDLRSRRLDFKDLAGFIGADPTPKEEPRKRLFPDQPYNLKALRAGDADVEFRGDNIITPNLPIDKFVAHLRLDHGKLDLAPLNFVIDIGHITSTISLNAQQEKIGTKANVEINQVPLKRLLANTPFAEQSSGTFVGRANVDARGNSIAEMLGFADGDITILMENGRISNLLMELLGLDVAESLGLFLTKDPSIPIRCIIADFKVSQGLMKTQPFVIDTTDTNVIGDGWINLRDEAVDLRLTAYPKDPSLFSMRAPLIVKGALKKPAAYPDPATLATKTAASVILGTLLTPAGAIIPWIELGLGEDSPCRALITAAKERKIAPPRKKRR